MSDISTDDWSIQCFDSDDPQPTPEELETAYRNLENGVILELEWKCPGRRAPSPAEKDEPVITDIPEKETPSVTKDFDFTDETPLTTIRVRSSNATPKGSAKKKTTNFAGVIDSMKKHGRLLENKDHSSSSSQN